MSAPGVLLLCVLSLTGVVSSAASQPGDPDPNRFAQEIKAFAEWDSKNAVPADPVVFVGSSSIRLWRTHESFPDLPVVNRGFGGSQISDALHFADPLVLAYKPRVVVFYSGGNDIAAGKSARRVAEDCRRFLTLVRARRPGAHAIILGLNPSRSRWKLWPEMKKANELIQTFCENDPRLVFADFSPRFLGADGMPDSRLFLKDELHLNAKGYAVWTRALTPVLQKVVASPESPGTQ